MGDAPHIGDERVMGLQLQAAPRTDGDLRGNGPRVLMALRDRSRWGAYEFALHVNGCSSLCAASEASCFRALAEFRPDVIIIEPTLFPRGFEGLLAAMRGRDDAPLTPILVCGPWPERQECDVVGFPIIDHFDALPSPAQLAAGVRALFAYRTWRSMFQPDGAGSAGAPASGPTASTRS